jgi:hypothetical protein
MPHAVLLGDSIFDNQAFVRRGEPDVIHQLRGGCPRTEARRCWRWTAASRRGLAPARAPAPTEATHLVLSAGGNDALGQVSVLNETAPSRRARPRPLRCHPGSVRAERPL